MNSWPSFTFLKSHLEVLHTFVVSLKNMDSGPAPISRLHGLFFFPVIAVCWNLSPNQKMENICKEKHCTKQY